MSFFTQQGGQYAVDEYSNPPTPRDLNFPQPPHQWEQPSRQDSQHSQASESDPQQTIEPHNTPIPALDPSTVTMSLYPAPLEEPTHIVPSQMVARGTHDPSPIRLHQPGSKAIDPIVVLDTTVRSTAHAGPSTRPASRARPRQYHPYERPPTASGSSTAAAAPHGHRREHQQHVRMPSQAHTPQAHSPVATTGMGRQFASPLSEYSLPLPTGSSPSFIASPPSALPEGGLSLPPPIPPPPREQRYIIRTDTQYDPHTRIFTALLEVPGLKRADMHIALATTTFNRCRHVTVSGQSRPVFSPIANPASGILRERKYGRFTRNFPVPPETKPEDIDAAMEDGVLVLKISCGLPAASADEHEIPIR